MIMNITYNIDAILACTMYARSVSSVLRVLKLERRCRYFHKNLKTDSLGLSLREKILYNTVIDGESYSFRKEVLKKRREEYEKRKVAKQVWSGEGIPLCLQYESEESEKSEECPTEAKEPIKTDKPVRLPFSAEHEQKVDLKDNVDDKSWMTAYEGFDDANLNREYLERAREQKYNVFDANRADDISDIPCGGCGAILHCKQASIPGYLPPEIFKGRSQDELKAIVCQRCHFLNEYKVALNMRVSPQDYPKLLMKIRPERALTILMVDLLDFPCSIWPGMMDIIGYKRPVIIVGNKVDLLPKDSHNYLKHVKHCLKESVIQSDIREANVKDVILISAKTGYGIEELISKLHSTWAYKGNVYLIGCTNVGKSSLFNALLQSDYCKEHASDLIQRATVSQWPGTTLNLLKFPILRPEGWKLHMRFKRLQENSQLAQQEKEYRKIMFKSSRNPIYTTLVGHVGKTFTNNKETTASSDPFSSAGGFKNPKSGIGIDENSKHFKLSKWCFDTPGVVHPEQIISMLTVEELMLTLSKTLIRPRSYHMHSGTTLLLAGIGRLDLLECQEPARFTVFASRALPVTICKTQDANDVYQMLLGTELMAVPAGNDERISRWPGLDYGEEISIVGMGMKESSSDVVLSSAGWISITGEKGLEYKLLAWTPQGRGIHLRTPALLPFANMLKGKRIKRTPAYNIGYMYEER